MAATSGGASARAKVIKVPGKPFKKAPERLPWPRKSDPDENGTVVDLGVDVVAKRPDIVKIVHKFFKVENVPMEELLQEVFVAVIHKNCTRSAHDPRKSSFGHYVYMVANNVCINLVHKGRRYEKERESLDAPNGYDDSRTLLDTMEVEPEPSGDESLTEHMEAIEDAMRHRGMWDLARYVRATRSGASPDVIREALTWGDKRVSSKTIRDIRAQVRDLIQDIQVQQHA